MGSKSVPPPTPQPQLFEEDEYPCDLSQETQDILKKDLREDEKARTQMLRTLRDWIRKQPHIQNCRMDANFLLRFLRVKCYNYLEVQEGIEYYISRRMVYPQYFNFLDPLETEIYSLIDNGLYCPLLEKDDDGRVIVYSTLRAVDPIKHSSTSCLRTAFLMCESVLEDEEVQARALTYLFDGGNVGLSTVAMFSITEVNHFVNICEHVMPIRYDKIHMVNLNTMVTKLVELAKMFMSEDLKKRMVNHKNVDSLQKSVPVRILPKEFGGEVPLRDMIGIQD